MKTQATDVTPRMGTVTFSTRFSRLLAVRVHTGTARVIFTKEFGRPYKVTVLPVGDVYVTGTMEDAAGNMVALSDTRVSNSPFAEGWR